MENVMHTRILAAACGIVAVLLSQNLLGDKVQCVEDLSEQDLLALEVGRKISSIMSALQAPEKQSSIDAVQALGLDSRYYVMVRGWLVQHIRMTQSYRGTSLYNESEQQRNEVEDRIAALSRMLRAIELE